jgi:hypothetical protein
MHYHDAMMTYAYAVACIMLRYAYSGSASSVLLVVVCMR